MLFLYILNVTPCKRQKEPEAVKRDSWMTDLPEMYRKTFGTGPRTFKPTTYEVTEAERRVWIESPAEAAKRREVL